MELANGQSDNRPRLGRTKFRHLKFPFLILDDPEFLITIYYKDEFIGVYAMYAPLNESYVYDAVLDRILDNPPEEYPNLKNIKFKIERKG